MDFEGVPIGQINGVVETFFKYAKEFDRIIEIGTWSGALTLLLFRLKREDAELVSYDIDLSNYKVAPYIPLDVRRGDCFNPFTHKQIVDLIQAPGRVLVLCDGGQKNREIIDFSAYIKPNDVIMCHDYCEVYDEWVNYAYNRGWQSVFESSWDEIHEKLEANGIKKYEHYDEFKQILWGAFTK